MGRKRHRSKRLKGRLNAVLGVHTDEERLLRVHEARKRVGKRACAKFAYELIEELLKTYGYGAFRYPPPNASVESQRQKRIANLIYTCTLQDIDVRAVEKARNDDCHCENIELLIKFIEDWDKLIVLQYGSPEALSLFFNRKKIIKEFISTSRLIRLGGILCLILEQALLKNEGDIWHVPDLQPWWTSILARLNTTMDKLAINFDEKDYRLPAYNSIAVPPFSYLRQIFRIGLSYGVYTPPTTAYADTEEIEEKLAMLAFEMLLAIDNLPERFKVDNGEQCIIN